MDRIRTAAWLLLIAFLSAAAGVALWNGTHPHSRPTLASLTVLPQPKLIADFRLRDQDDRPFSLANLQGKWSLLFFGYTQCPDICPIVLFDLKQVEESLAQDYPDIAVHQVVFVSVDPERDSAARLKDYLAYFDPDFTGVTGEQAQLLPLARQLGVAYRIEEHEPGNDQYAVQHSSSVLVISPSGRLYGVFTAPLDPEEMAADLATVLS